MFCPECGEVMGPGPIDRRRSFHCQCGAVELTGTTVRLWRAIWTIFGRAKSFEDRPKTIDPSETASRDSNDQIIRE
jgi:hypothetical protein